MTVSTTPRTPEEPTTQSSDVLTPGNAYEGETEEAKAARQAAIREAYSKAQTKLRVDHLDEFNTLVKGFAKDAGYAWSPKPTKADRAREQLQALLAEHPELASEVTPVQS